MPRTLFNIPKMMVSKKGYNNYVGDVTWNQALEMGGYMVGSRTVDDFAYTFEKFPELTDSMVAYAFNQIGMHNYDRNENFWAVVLPRVKKQLKAFDRQCILSIYSIIQGGAMMQLQDNEFWEIVEQQLIDNKLHRYLNIDQICSLVYCLGRVGRGSDELIEICEKYIIKHRKALTSTNIRQASTGFKELNKGSAVLFEVLGDPTRGLTQIAA